MISCNDLFLKFLSEITIKTECSKKLQRGREAIKREIDNYFSNKLKVGQPDFYLQGSYSLKTMIEPLDLEDEYDLDDGIYLKHTDDDISKPTTEEVSNWIFKAVEGHTKKKPENKKNCVRVIYAEGYHIDLAIYRKINGKYHLARLGEDQWVPSDARAFNNCFYTRLEKTEQMRSCIKYLKAWKDYEGCDLKGIHITVLVGLNHIAVKDRDDVSLTQTIQKIIAHMKNNRSICNPIENAENLISDWSDSKINKVIEALEKLHAKASGAIETDNKEKAANLWRIMFGDRFPVFQSDEKDESSDKNQIKITPVVITNPSKNWGPL
jgi:hypothetical protein